MGRRVAEDRIVRRLSVILMLLLGLALVPAACGGGDDDDVAVATDLIEQWIAAWNSNDNDAIAALFTEDGTHTGDGVHELSLIGREEIRSEANPGLIWNIELTGPVTVADDGTFACSIRFYGGANEMVAEIEFEVEDGLISRLVHHDEYADATP